MSDNNYNPENDDYLNHLKGLRKKKDELAKIDRKLSDVKKEIPMDRIKKDAEELKRNKKKRIIVIISALILIIALITAYFIIGSKDKPMVQKTFNVIKFDDISLNNDINSRIINYADSINQEIGEGLIRLNLLNNNQSYEVKDFSAIKDSIIFKPVKTKRITIAGDLIVEAIKAAFFSRLHGLIAVSY